MAIFKAFTFQGSKTAAKALDAISETNDYGWIDDVAVLSRNKRGFIRVDSSWGQSDTALGAVAGAGALTGALLGALMGPQGAIAGAVGAGVLGGGSLGAVIGGMTNLAFADPRLEDFAAQLKNDTSALILVAEAIYIDEFGTVFAPFAGSVTETELNEHDIKALSEALKAAEVRSK